MALRTPDTQQDPDQDSGNPAQEYYDREFNEIAHNLREQEGNALEATHGDGDKEDIQARGTEGLDDIRQSEESGGWDTKVSAKKPPRKVTGVAKVKETAKKLVPTGAILSLIGGGFLSLGNLGTFPFTVIETFTNGLNDPFSSQYRKQLDIDSSLLDGKKEDRDKACQKPTSMACRRVSITKDTAKEFEDGGFKLNSKGIVGDRITFASLGFPNNLGTVDTPDGFKRLIASSDGAFAALNKVRNLRTDFFNRPGFYNKVLSRLGVSKGDHIKGETKEEAEESYKKATSGEREGVSVQTDKTAEEGSEEDKRKARENNASGDGIAGELNDAAARGTRLQKISISLRNGAVSVVQLGCTAYNTTKVVVNYARAELAARLIKFTYTLASSVHRLKAGANALAETEVILDVFSPNSLPAKVFDPTTNQEIDNPWVGKNITDSGPFKALNGSKEAMDPIALRYVQGSGTVGVMKDIIDWMNNNLGKKNIRTICKIANNPVAGIIGLISSPVLGLGMELIASFLPVEEIAAAIVNTMIDMLAGIDITNDMKGVLAGYGMFVGFSEIYSAAGTSFGQVPRPLQKIQENMAFNNQILEREIAIAKKDASATPLDINNRYSFLGSLAINLQHLLPSSIQGSSVSSPLSKLMAFPSASLGMLSKNANAAYSMPVTGITDERFDQCDDADLKEELNIKPDLICEVRTAPFDEVVSDESIKYMKSTGQADDDGNVTPGTPLERFKQFCKDRTDKWGTTTVPVEEQEEAKIGWYTGRNCIPENVDAQTANENKMASEYFAAQESMNIRDKVKTSGAAGGGGAGPVVSGDAKAMALSVANNSNIRFVSPNTKTQLEKFARGDPVTNECGKPFAISKYLLSAILANTTKYSILVNNFGFREDRSGTDDCAPGNEGRQHPLGQAIDINQIQIIGGAGTGPINFSGGQAAIANQYASDFLAALPRNRGGVGQSNCGMNPTFPPGSIALNGNHLFEDACDHLHIDARDRVTLTNLQ